MNRGAGLGGAGRGQAARRRSLRAFKVRNFRLYFAGQVVSTVGSWMQMLAQSWLVLQLTNSAVSLGVTMMLQTLPVLVLGAWGGVITDRVDTRRLLTVTSIAGIAQAVGLGTMQATGAITVHWLYLFALLLGMISAFERPAMQAMLFELVEPDELPSAIGIASTINASGRLAGPALAGLVIAAAGMAPCFYINAVSFGAVLVTVALFRTADLRPRLASDARSVKLRDGLAYVWGDRTLRLALIVMTIVGTFAYNFAVFVPSMIRFEFHAGPGSLGVVQSIGGVGSVVGGLAVGSIHRPSTRVLGLAASAFGLMIFVVALSPSLVVFAALWLPLGLASAVFSTTDQMVLQHNARPEYQGRVMSLFTIAWMGTTPIGALIMGPIIDTASTRVAMCLGATAAVAAGLLALLASGRVRGNAQAAPVPEVVPLDFAGGT